MIAGERCRCGHPLVNHWQTGKRLCMACPEGECADFAPVASQADGELRARVEAARFGIENGWLTEYVDEHTCGTGRDGHYGAHEPGCGMVPVARISDLLADAAKVQRVRDAIDRHADNLSPTQRAAFARALDGGR